MTDPKWRPEWWTDWHEAQLRELRARPDPTDDPNEPSVAERIGLQIEPLEPGPEFTADEEAKYAAREAEVVLGKVATLSLDEVAGRGGRR